MKIKEDMREKRETGWTIFDIAEHYHTPVENVMRILGLPVENPFSYELH